MTLQHNRSKLLAILLLGGFFFLAANLGWLGLFANWLWALLFLVGGVAFLYLHRIDKTCWWALIPGFGFLGLGAAVLMPGDAGGSFFLGLTGAGFAAVYLNDRRRWWAIIPAGSLLTLALVAWLDVWTGDASWLFFLGLAATFGTLVALPEGKGKQRWAIYPALGTLALALVTLVSSGVGGLLFPLLLIGLGALQLWRGGGSVPPTSKEG